MLYYSTRTIFLLLFSEYSRRCCKNFARVDCFSVYNPTPSPSIVSSFFPACVRLNTRLQDHNAYSVCSVEFVLLNCTCSSHNLLPAISNSFTTFQLISSHALFNLRCRLFDSICLLLGSLSQTCADPGQDTQHACRMLDELLTLHLRHLQFPRSPWPSLRAYSHKQKSTPTPLSQNDRCIQHREVREEAEARPSG